MDNGYPHSEISIKFVKIILKMKKKDMLVDKL
jgi:hypothetical protein